MFVPFRAASSTKMGLWHESGHVLFHSLSEETETLLSGAPHLALEDLEVESPDLHVVAPDKHDALNADKLHAILRFLHQSVFFSPVMHQPHRRLHPLLSRDP